MIKFFVPETSDKRIPYAVSYLEGSGLAEVSDEKNADFLLLGVNDSYNSAVKRIDYKNNENFEIKNSFLTAEAALAVAVSESDESLVNSKVLITGYGRIGKALCRCLYAFTPDITVCARKSADRATAGGNNAKVCDFSSLKEKNDYDYIFNTVPHPVFNADELSAVKKDVVIIDLASFPGGVDRHIAFSKGIKLIQARGLPGKYSPKAAGRIVGECVKEMIKEGKA